MATQSIPLQVRTCECDSCGHVNHAVCLHYLKDAGNELLENWGFGYWEFVAAGHCMVITHGDIVYRSAARVDDLLRIETTPLKTRRISGTLSQRIFPGERLVAGSRVSWCVTDREGNLVRPAAEWNLEQPALG